MMFILSHKSESNRKEFQPPRNDHHYGKLTPLMDYRIVEYSLSYILFKKIHTILFQYHKNSPSNLFLLSIVNFR